MTHLENLNLSSASPRTPTTPLQRKRTKLLGKLQQQIQAAQAEARDEEFVEEIRRWVRDEETGERTVHALSQLTQGLQSLIL